MYKNLKNKLKDNKGFSLVELIVVIAIMVILIAMLVPNVVGYMNKARLATERQAAATIYSAAQMYVTDLYAQGAADPSWATDGIIDTADEMAAFEAAGLVSDLDKYTDLKIKAEPTDWTKIIEVTFNSSTGGTGEDAIVIQHPASAGDEIDPG